MESYLTISCENKAELIEKRSRFIATVRHCKSEEEALSFIEEMRSHYWDAKHNVFAYSINENNVKRFSDDGEPHGTAGKPVLDVITGSGITDIALVVTRYFGGVLLGTGGLVRAYSKSAKDALDTAEIVEMVPCVSFVTSCEYTEHGKLTNLISICEGVVDNTEFNSNVSVSYHMKSEMAETFLKKLCELFSARVTATLVEEKLFPLPFCR